MLLTSKTFFRKYGPTQPAGPPRSKPVARSYKDQNILRVTPLSRIKTRVAKNAGTSQTACTSLMLRHASSCSSQLLLFLQALVKTHEDRPTFGVHEASRGSLSLPG